VGIELYEPDWIGVDLFCDGIDDFTMCVLGDDGPGMITNAAPTEEGARQLVLGAAKDLGWQFDTQTQRWLCPDCLTAQNGKVPSCKILMFATAKVATS
jgi:hypothetical protein